MKPVYKYVLHTVFIGIMAILFSYCSEKSGNFITVKSSMIINETGFGNSMAWFDEQDTASFPQTQWETSGQEDFWPASIVIDLGQAFKITGFWIFDGPKTNFNGTDYEHANGHLKIKTGNPFSWEDQVNYELSNDSAWHFVNLNKTSRFIQLLKVSNQTFLWNTTGPFQCDSEIREIILCGYPAEQPKPDNNNVTQEFSSLDATSKKGPNSGKMHYRDFQTSIDQFIGINSFSWSSEPYYSQLGSIREYHHWKLNGAHSVKDPISWVSLKTRVSFDLFYKQNPGKVCVDVHRNFQEDKYGEMRPDFGNDPADPASYELIADYMFQYAARYGKTAVSDSLLRVKLGEPVISGTGWVSYLETWNEPDRWWGKKGDHFTPYQMSAMASATYDGHLGAMGLTYGGKTADPEMKMVLGGLATMDTSYISAMKFWSDYNRNGFFPADVISFHHYCNTAGGQGFFSDTKGISPEADDFKGRMQKMVKWRNRNLPSCEIWISEFGWDSSPGSPQSATGHKQYPDKINANELQAMWLVRGYLAGAAAGVDRMFMFMLNDKEGDGLFKSSGLLTTGNKPKPSWYYLCTLKNSLNSTFFKKEILSGHPDVWIYQFSDKENSKDIYVLWCPTSDGTIVKNYMFSVSDSIRNAKLIQLVDGIPLGKISPLKLTHNMVGIEVTETPVMIVIEK